MNVSVIEVHPHTQSLHTLNTQHIMHAKIQVRTSRLLAGNGHQLVHVDVGAVEVHPAHPVLDVRLPPVFGFRVERSRIRDY